IAIILDRITQNLRNPAYKHMLKPKLVFAIVAVLFIGTAIVLGISKANTTTETGDPNSIGAQTEYEIIGIEPGAGIMAQASKALEDYGLDQWTLVEGSSAAMVAELQKAYHAEKPIIVTGWSPHWKFASFKL